MSAWQHKLRWLALSTLLCLTMPRVGYAQRGDQAASSRPGAQEAVTEPGGLGGQPPGSAQGQDAQAAAAQDASRASGKYDNGEEGLLAILKDHPRLLRLHGYVQPQLGVLWRNRAVPRDQVAFDLGGRFGVIFQGAHGHGVLTYMAHLRFDASGRNFVTAAKLIDRDGNGSPDGLSLAPRKVQPLDFEQLTVGFSPSRNFQAQIGRIRIPFTYANVIVNSKLMFPDRPTTSELFLSGADLGITVEGALDGRRYRLVLGAFEGSSLGLLNASDKAFGPVYSARLEVEPFGKVKPFSLKEKGFRLGFGGGFLLRYAQVFDQAGYDTTTFTDMRASLSLRLSVANFYAQFEGLRRQRETKISDRSDHATGVYGQLSYFIPVQSTQALQPIARGGMATLDETFDQRRVFNIDVGLAYFPLLEGDKVVPVRFILQYLGELRLDEGETAHGVRLQGSVAF